MRPFVGCVIQFVSSRPLESKMFDREWIIWGKKGNTVWLIEHLRDIFGPADMAVGYFHECVFVNTEPNYKNFYPPD